VLHPDHPERGGRDREPEAVDEDGAEHDGDAEPGDRAGGRRSAESGESDRDDAEPDDDVDELPHGHLADADQQLRVHRLEQQVVELALADVVHQQLHVGLDDRLDHAPQQHVDPEHHQQLRRGPAAERVGVLEDQRDHGDGGPERHGGLQQLEPEVHAVLQLVEGTDPQVGRDDVAGAHQLPTAP
jgi:hypothetical protein